MDYFAIDDFMLEEGGDYYGVVTEEWLTANGFVHNDEGECWELTGNIIDDDNNGLPDILEALLKPSVVERPSQNNTGA